MRSSPMSGPHPERVHADEVELMADDTDYVVYSERSEIILLGFGDTFKVVPDMDGGMIFASVDFGGEEAITTWHMGLPPRPRIWTRHCAGVRELERDRRRR